MPRGRSFPLAFGMKTRRTGSVTVALQAQTILEQSRTRSSSVVLTTPSMPGVLRPLFSWAT